MSNNMWRKTLVYLGLVEEPEEHDEYERTRSQRYADDAERPMAAAADGGGVGRRVHRRESGRDTNIRPLRPAADRPKHVRPVEGGLIRVGIVRATDFDDAENVGERYRTGQPVLLDLAEVDTRTGRRLLDFVSGITYALRGRIVPAGTKAFLLLPDGVELPADERRRLADLGYHVQTAAPPADA